MALKGKSSYGGSSSKLKRSRKVFPISESANSPLSVHNLSIKLDHRYVCKPKVTCMYSVHYYPGLKVFPVDTGGLLYIAQGVLLIGGP